MSTRLGRALGRALGVASGMSSLMTAATAAGTAQGSANALADALAKLRTYRATLDNTYSTAREFQIVLQNDGPGGFDSVNKTMTYSNMPVYQQAWGVVAQMAAPSAPPFAAQTVNEAIRLLDQVLLYWGDRKLVELRQAAAVEAQRAREIAAQQAAAQQAAAQQAAAQAATQAAAVAAAQQAAAAETARKQQLLAAEQAAVAAAQAATEAARVAGAKHQRNVMLLAAAVGAVVIVSIGAIVALKKKGN